MSRMLDIGGLFFPEAGGPCGRISDTELHPFYPPGPHHSPFLGSTPNSQMILSFLLAPQTFLK
jgi:hypothetical protein